MTKIASAFLATISIASVALAADTKTDFGGRAVSAPNGKIEIGAGIADFDNIKSDEIISGGAAFSLPVGDAFGFQGDISVSNSFGRTSVVGGGHAFTRDPNAYLLGVYGGVADIGAVTGKFIGPEIEIYADNVSFEALGGYVNLDTSGAPAVNRMYASAGLGFYATDDFLLRVGGSSVARFESARVGFEWLAADLGLPAAIKGDLRFGEDKFVSAEVGLAFYFGGDEEGKSLKRRHREDDPAIRAFDIFGSGSGGVIDSSGVLPILPVANVGIVCRPGFVLSGGICKPNGGR